MTYSAKPREAGGYRAQAVGAGVKLAPGETHRFDTRLYIGTKLQDSVEDIAPGFDLTLDYAILTPTAKPIFWLLKNFTKLTYTWGRSPGMRMTSVQSSLSKHTRKPHPPHPP